MFHRSRVQPSPVPHRPWWNPLIPRKVVFVVESLGLVVIVASITIVGAYAHQVATSGDARFGGITLPVAGLGSLADSTKDSNSLSTTSRASSNKNGATPSSPGTASSDAGNNSGTSGSAGGTASGGGSSNNVPDGPIVASSLVGWQKTAANTGLTSVGISCGNLPVYTGSAKPAAGTSISRVRFTSPVDFSNGNISVDRACFQPTSAGQGMPIVTASSPSVAVSISNSEFDGTLLGQSIAAASSCFRGIANLSNVYCHHFGNGISLYATGGSLDASISNNYVTDMISNGARSAALGIYDFSATNAPNRRLIINNNHLNCDTPNATGALSVQTSNGDIDNVTIFANLFEGNGYNTSLIQGYGHAYSNLVTTNNRFTSTGSGYASVQGGPRWSTWSQNYQNDGTKTDNKGAAIATP